MHPPNLSRVSSFSYSSSGYPELVSDSKKERSPRAVYIRPKCLTRRKKWFYLLAFCVSALLILLRRRRLGEESDEAGEGLVVGSQAGGKKMLRRPLTGIDTEADERDDSNEKVEKSRYEHLVAQSFGPASFTAPVKTHENRSRLQRKRDSKREKAASIRKAAEAKAKSEELRMKKIEQRRKAKAEKQARREVERNMRGGIEQVDSTIKRHRRHHHALEIDLPAAAASQEETHEDEASELSQDALNAQPASSQEKSFKSSSTTNTESSPLLLLDPTESEEPSLSRGWMRTRRRRRR